MKLSYPSPVANLQAASAVPQLIRASKTFTGAANLGAVGVNELFTTTGVVEFKSFYVRCTTDLVDAVDGALFRLGITGNDGLFASTNFEGLFDLDTIDAGEGLETDTPSAAPGWAWNLEQSSFTHEKAIFANIIMTISAQAITGGVLEFYILYLPLSSNGALTLGAGMVSL